MKRKLLFILPSSSSCMSQWRLHARTASSGKWRQRDRNGRAGCRPGCIVTIMAHPYPMPNTDPHKLRFAELYVKNGIYEKFGLQGDKSRFDKVKKIKSQYPHVKILLSLPIAFPILTIPRTEVSPPYEESGKCASNSHKTAKPCFEWGHRWYWHWLNFPVWLSAAMPMTSW